MSKWHSSANLSPLLSQPTQPKPIYKIAVLVSGSGSNLQALIDKLPKSIAIVGVISNNVNAYALQRAKTADIATVIIDKDANGNRYTRQAFERLALESLKAWQPNLVVLAGFMKIVTPFFIAEVGKLGATMINLHPSLLPAYKGLDTHARALNAGDNKHGCSVHLVSAELDAGTVLTQAVLNTTAHDTPDTLAQRVHLLEHQLLPWTVSLFADGIMPNPDCLPLPWRLAF